MHFYFFVLRRYGTLRKKKRNALETVMAVSNCGQLPVGHVGPSRTRWNALAVLMAGAPTCAQLPAEGDTGLGGLHHESGHVLQMLLALLASAGRAALGLMPCLQASGRACNSKTSQHTGRRWLLRQ